MIDVATFKASFPEFQDAPDALVSAKLEYSKALTPNEVWGADTENGVREQGVFNYTARFLALSPFARKMALVNKSGITNYDADINRLKAMVTSGFRGL